jgi:hypothetical protein
MKLLTKGLWIEDLNKSNKARIVRHIQDIGANLICVRTTSGILKELLPMFQTGMKLKVYGWRWPHAYSSRPNPHDDSAFAPNEMNTVIGLVQAGLDGYVFDIESENDGKPNDWDIKGPANRAEVAADMVSGIAGAFKARNKPYVLGLTSHQRGFTNYPKVPWQVFLNECNALFPQTYWRRDTGNPGKKVCTDGAYDYKANKPTGTPDQALRNGFTDYADKHDASGKLLPVFPVAGEITCAKAGEMRHFGALVAQRNLTEAHFYVDVDKPGYDPAKPQDGDARVLPEIAAL